MKEKEYHRVIQNQETSQNGMKLRRVQAITENQKYKLNPN